MSTISCFELNICFPAVPRILYKKYASKVINILPWYICLIIQYNLVRYWLLSQPYFYEKGHVSQVGRILVKCTKINFISEPGNPGWEYILSILPIHVWPPPLLLSPPYPHWLVPWGWPWHNEVNVSWFVVLFMSVYIHVCIVGVFEGSVLYYLCGFY